MFSFVLIGPFRCRCCRCSPWTADHEEKQNKLRALRNRQDLFQEEGILNLILDAIDKITVITAQGYMAALAGEGGGQNWDIISGHLYQLLGISTLFVLLLHGIDIRWSACFFVQPPLLREITPTVPNLPSHIA